MRDMLTTLGGRWVVRDEEWCDGLTGARVNVADPLAGVDRSEPLPSAFLTGGPTEELQLVVSWSMRIWTDERTQLGHSVETFLAGLDLGAPMGWGLGEPVTRPWSMAAVTEFARSRMPQPTCLVVVGAGARAVLTMTVQRTSHGVEEMCTGLVGLGGVDDPAAARRLAAVPQVLAAMCEGTMPLFGLVLARSGPSDLTCWPRLPGPPMPVAMLIGPPGVIELGVDVLAEADRWGAVVAGRKKFPALVYPLVASDGADPSRLSAILAGFDRDKLRAVFARSAVQLPAED